MNTKIIAINSRYGELPAVIYTPTVKKSDLCVVMLHGRGEAEPGIAGTTINALSTNTNHANLLLNAEKFGFTVLAPQVVTRWLGGPWWLAEYTNICVDYARDNLTDLPKVGLTGLSQGGGGCWSYITSEWAGKVYFALPICPTPQYEGDFSLIGKNKIGVWNFHAADDTTVSVSSSRNMVAKANSAGADPKVKYEELPSGNHYIWGTVWARQDIYPWMLSHVSAEGTTPPPVDEILSTHKLTYYKSGKVTVEKM